MAVDDAWVTRHDRSSLRVLGSVGEPINPEVWRWYFEVVGEGRCPIADTWWQTETGAHMISGTATRSSRVLDPTLVGFATAWGVSASLAACDAEMEWRRCWRRLPHAPRGGRAAILRSRPRHPGRKRRSPRGTEDVAFCSHRVWPSPATLVGVSRPCGCRRASAPACWPSAARGPPCCAQWQETMSGSRRSTSTCTRGCTSQGTGARGTRCGPPPCFASAPWLLAAADPCPPAPSAEAISANRTATSGSPAVWMT